MEMVRSTYPNQNVPATFMRNRYRTAKNSARNTKSPMPIMLIGTACPRDGICTDAASTKSRCSVRKCLSGPQLRLQ